MPELSVLPNRAVASLREYAVASQDVWHLEDSDSVLKLDWNESTYVNEALKKHLIQVLNGTPGILNWYPDVTAISLRKAVAQHLQCSPFEVMIFGGSDVALEAVARTYLEPGQRAAVVDPGYDNFRLYAESCGAEIVRVGTGAEPASYQFDGLLSSLRAAGPLKLIYLISPNNPVGYLIPPDDIRTIAKWFPNTAIVVDEAYIEFAGSGASVVPLISEHDNLIVSRSFSKAYGLAGLRLGFLVSAPGNLMQIGKLRNGKNVCTLAQEAGLFMLNHKELLRQCVADVVEAREWFIERYRAAGGEVFGSHANFVLIRVNRPEEVLAYLRDKSIYFRDRSQMRGLEGMLRATVGRKREMERVLKTLRSMPSDLWKARSQSHLCKGARHTEADDATSRLREDESVRFR